jgi:hypothetical protein
VISQELSAAVIVILALSAIGISVVAFDDKRSSRVDVHVDAENNVICYVTDRAMQCFVYSDEGTHLEVKP